MHTDPFKVTDTQALTRLVKATGFDLLTEIEADGTLHHTLSTEATTLPPAVDQSWLEECHPTLTTEAGGYDTEDVFDAFVSDLKTILAEGEHLIIRR